MRRFHAGRWPPTGVAAAVAVCCCAVWSDTAQAQALDMDQPEIKAGESELRSVNILNRGFRAGSAGEPGSSHEVGAGYAFADWFKAIIHLDVENLIDEELIADHIGLEALFALRAAGEDGGLSLGWYTGAMLSIDPLSTNALVFGPIVKFAHGKAAMTLNAYGEETFGRNSDPGLNFLYGWQARYEIVRQVAVGLEGFGKVENLASPPAIADQDHRVGPGIFITWDGDGGRSFGVDAGVLAGLTDASPDMTFKLNFGVVQ